MVVADQRYPFLPFWGVFDNFSGEIIEFFQTIYIKTFAVFETLKITDVNCQFGMFQPDDFDAIFMCCFQHIGPAQSVVAVSISRIVCSQVFRVICRVGVASERR